MIIKRGNKKLFKLEKGTIIGEYTKRPKGYKLDIDDIELHKIGDSDLPKERFKGILSHKLVARNPIDVYYYNDGYFINGELLLTSVTNRSVERLHCMFEDIKKIFNIPNTCISKRTHKGEKVDSWSFGIQNYNPFTYTTLFTFKTLITNKGIRFWIANEEFLITNDSEKDILVNKIYKYENRI